MEQISIDILIVTALPEELKTLRSYLSLHNKVQSDTCQLTYDIGPLQTEKEGVSYLCATTCLHDMGNTGSGVSAACAIQDLNPTYVIMFGLAAGIKDKIDLGDVIIPTHIFYYELAKIRPGDVVEIRPHSYEADMLLKNKLGDFATSYAGKHRVEFGSFAAGEKVVADTNAVKKLLQVDPKLIGIEMESYGVARAAAGMLYRPRFITVRGVSDYADENKNDDFRKVALTNAAQFLVSFFKTGVLSKDKPTFTASEISSTSIAIHHLSLDKRASIQATAQGDILKYLGPEVKQISIDQTDLYTNGVLANPYQAFKRQTGLLAQLRSFLDSYPSAQVSYFGLAHIPLMFHAGYVVNRQPVKVFPTSRQTGDWISLKKTGRGPKLMLEETGTKFSLESGDVVVRVSISYEVRHEQIEGVVEHPLGYFHLKLDRPRTNIVVSEEQLERYAKQFYQLLEDIHAHFPNRKRIHLFMSAPPTVVFRFGQQVSKTTHPEILVYNFSFQDKPAYGWFINVVTGEVTDFRSSNQEASYV